MLNVNKCKLSSVTTPWGEIYGDINDQKDLIELIREKTQFAVSMEEVQAWVESQEYLTEHQPIKTINGESIVGEGDVEITGVTPEQEELINQIPNKADKSEIPSLEGYATEEWVEGKGYLTEHQSIKTINGETIVGEGDVEITGVTPEQEELINQIPNKADKSEIPSLEGYATEEWVEDKGYLTHHQPIKTVNGESLIGEGDIEIKGGAVVPDIKKIKPYFYEINYTNLDYEFAKENLPEPIYGGCSVVSNYLTIGRNYDWKYDNKASFLVKTPAMYGRHAVVGMCGGISELTEEFVDSLTYSDAYKLLPFNMLDGANDSGLFVCMNVVPSTGEMPTEGDICDTMLVRYLLDNYSSVEEVVNALPTLNIYNNPQLAAAGYELHFFVSGWKTVDYYMHPDNRVIEWKGGLQIIEANQMTNFHLTGVTFNEDGSVYTPEDACNGIGYPRDNGITNGSGLERWNILLEASKADFGFNMQTFMSKLNFTNAYKDETNPAWYSEFVDPNTDNREVAEAAFNNAKAEYERRDRETSTTWQSVHSCIYDLNFNSSTIKVSVQEDNDYSTSAIASAADIIQLGNDEQYTSISDTDLTLYQGDDYFRSYAMLRNGGISFQTWYGDELGGYVNISPYGISYDDINGNSGNINYADIVSDLKTVNGQSLKGEGNIEIGGDYKIVNTSDDISNKNGSIGFVANGGSQIVPAQIGSKYLSYTLTQPTAYSSSASLNLYLEGTSTERFALYFNSANALCYRYATGSSYYGAYHKMENPGQIGWTEFIVNSDYDGMPQAVPGLPNFNYKIEVFFDDESQVPGLVKISQNGDCGYPLENMFVYAMAGNWQSIEGEKQEAGGMFIRNDGELESISNYIEGLGFVKSEDIPSLDGYATEDWVNQQGFLTEHQSIKTVNGESIIGEGNVDIVGVTPEQEALINQVPNKVNQVRLVTDGSSIRYEGALESLTFEQIYALVMDNSKYVYIVMDNNIRFRPSAYDGDAIWFDSSFIEEGKANILRCIINSENRVDITQIVIASEEYVDEKVAEVEGKIPTVPTNVSAFTNDAGYLTEHQDISNLATKTEVETVESKIPNIFVGTHAEWDALTDEQKLTYTLTLLTD